MTVCHLRLAQVASLCSSLNGQNGHGFDALSIVLRARSRGCVRDDDRALGGVSVRVERDDAVNDRDNIGIVARVDRDVGVVGRLPPSEEVLDVVPRQLMPTRNRTIASFDASTETVPVLTRRQDDHTMGSQPLSQLPGLGDFTGPRNAIEDD